MVLTGGLMPEIRTMVAWSKIVERSKEIADEDVILLAGLALTTGLTSSRQVIHKNATIRPRVTVGPTLKEKAGSPTPPATAKNKAQKTSIGKGKTAHQDSTAVILLG